MSNADCWRTPDGRIGTEVARREIDSVMCVWVVIGGEGFPERAVYRLADLVLEVSRYEGARDGRVHAA